jgi:hypothetical protein
MVRLVARHPLHFVPMTCPGSQCMESRDSQQNAGGTLSDEDDGDGGVGNDVEGAFADEVGVGAVTWSPNSARN